MGVKRSKRYTLLLKGLLICSSPLHAEVVSVAVAANFTAPMKAIAQSYTQETPHQLQVIFGSSGRLYAQIKNGAPFAVFLSADTDKPTQLIADGLAVPDSLITYAIGRLALWSATPGLVDDQARVLLAGHFKHLALANPKLAPYGAAALEVMNHLGVTHKLQDRFVQGENIAQTYQFIQTGNAELGFVSLSQVRQENTGSVWLVPDKLHTPIRQGAVLLQSGKAQAAAQALMQYLQSPAAAAIIQSFGYASDKPL